MIQFFKKYINYFIYLIFLVLIFSMAIKLYQMDNLKTKYEVLMQDNDKHLVEIKFYDEKIKTLKDENKELYDSLKAYKDEVDYLIQFKYKKEYIFDTVYCNTVVNDDLEEKVFEYSNDLNDTLNYNLKIGSYYEPNWYKINFNISEQFTIVNKKYDDFNVTTVDTKTNNAIITDVTVFNKKETKFIDNFKFGPSVTMGYDIINKNVGIMLGVSLTYNIPLK